MNVSKRNLKGFTLVELLVVITIIAALLAILLPAMAKAKLQADVLIVNHDLYQIGLAIEAYETANNGKWPPVRYDCMAAEHMYSLPPELVDGGYITGSRNGAIHSSNIEDRYYKGHSYKYMSVETALNLYGTSAPDRYLYVSTNFPTGTDGKLVKYTKRSESPVKWVLFSLGPNYDKTKTRSFELDKGFPVANSFWYSPKTKKGILTRIKTNKDQYVGTFQSGR